MSLCASVHVNAQWEHLLPLKEHENLITCPLPANICPSEWSYGHIHNGWERGEGDIKSQWHAGLAHCHWENVSILHHWFPWLVRCLYGMEILCKCHFCCSCNALLRGQSYWVSPDTHMLLSIQLRYLCYRRKCLLYFSATPKAMLQSILQDQ